MRRTPAGAVVLYASVLLGLTGVATGVARPVNEFSETIRRQAGNMFNALLNGDYETFADGVYPGLIASMGTRAAFIDTTRRTMRSLHDAGLTMARMNVGTPSEYVRVGRDLQCTVPETTEVESDSARVRVFSYLIAISSDSGATWRFVQYSGQDRKQLRKFIPALSAKLALPKIPPPETIWSGDKR